MARNYRGFQASMAQEISTASLAAQATQSRKSKKITVHDSDLKKLVPSGSQIELKPTVFTKLKAGDVLYVRLNKQLHLRRFIKMKMTKDEAYLVVIHDGQKKAQVLPKGCLLGKVEKVTHAGKTYDPTRESVVANFVNALTEYGTHIPFSGILKRG